MEIIDYEVRLRATTTHIVRATSEESRTRIVEGVIASLDPSAVNVEVVSVVVLKP